jgi:hypothetical protein
MSNRRKNHRRKLYSRFIDNAVETSAIGSECTQHNQRTKSSDQTVLTPRWTNCRNSAASRAAAFHPKADVHRSECVTQCTEKVNLPSGRMGRFGPKAEGGPGHAETDAQFRMKSVRNSSLYSSLCAN